LTETSGIITAVAADFFVGKPASAGPAMPVFEARCVDTEGRTVGTNEVGELWVRGAQVIRGYLNRPDATAEAITEGWLHTGDVARIDEDGFIFIVDRIKDMVIRGGENLYPREIEEYLYRHPKVADVQVFGVPDPKYGEELCAWIKLADGESADDLEIREFCDGQIAHHKIPRYIHFVDEFPMTVTGKVQKFIMRDRMIETLGLDEEKTA
jgi:fatty-acyl-CoA synthase